MTELTCKKCGANLEADAAFCPVCGESTAKDGAAPAQERSESGGAHMPAGNESPAYEAYPKTETSMPSIPDEKEPHSLEYKEVCAAKGKDMPAEAAPLQKTSETAVSGARKREKKAPRKRSGAARFFAGAGSVLITLILLISILATAGVYLVRRITEPAQIQRVIYAADADAIYVDAITGEDVRLRTTLCDLISYNIPPVYQNAYHLDAKTISQLCGADFVRGFVAEKLCGYADSLFKGTDTGRMDEAELIAFLTENQTELSEILDQPLQSDDIQALSNLIIKGGFAEMTDLEAAKTQSPLPFAVIRWSFSGTAQIARLIFCAICWLLLFLLNQKRVGTACLYTGIALLVPGLVLTLCGLLRDMIASMIQIVFPIGPEFLRLVLKSLCAVSLETGVILCGAAIVLLIVHAGAKALRGGSQKSGQTL